MIPFVLLTIHSAALLRRRWGLLLAPIAIAALLLVDWVAAVALLFAILAYVLAFSETGTNVHWPTLAGVFAIAYLFTGRWLTLSTIATIRANTLRGDPALLTHQSLAGWLFLDVGALGLYLLFRRLRTDRWMRFACYYAFFCGVVVLGREWVGWHLLPQSNLLRVEFDLALCGLCGYVLVMAYDRVPRLMSGLFILFCIVQIFAFRESAKFQTRAFDITHTAEFQLARWYEAHMPGKRLFAPGIQGSWLNAFTSVPQMTGCCDDIVPNQEFPQASWAITTGQNAGAKDVEKSLLWLRAYGAEAIATNVDFWIPSKFDKTLPVLWRNGTNSVYDLQEKTSSLAHAISPEQVMRFIPENGLDTEVIEPYLEAIESEVAPHIESTWLNAHQLRIQGRMTPAQLISVQIGYDPGWHASVSGVTVPISPDALGMFVIAPHCQGECMIELNWFELESSARAAVLQVAAIAFLLLWACAPRILSLHAGMRLFRERAAGLANFKRWALLLPASLLGYLLFRTAWVAEDAYISFRVIDNFISGYGLTWNVDERVQVYTDPLFLGVVTLGAWLFGHVYVVAIVMSIVFTLAAFVLVTWNAKWSGLLVASVGLICSKGFVDFSVSGLENPATHLLLAIFLFAYFRSKRDPLVLSLIAALATVNRMDTALFFLPALLAVYMKAGWRVWWDAVRGWSPFLAWTAFSLFYYGFALPNTAYAKLNLGMRTQDLVWQGLHYYSAVWQFDTASALVIGLGLVVGCTLKEWALLAGVALNLIYVLCVGGDYMTSRFLTGAVFVSAALLARYFKMGPAPSLALAGMLLAAGVTIPAPTITSAHAGFGSPWPVNAELGVSDERAYWYPCTGLLRYLSRADPEATTHLTRENNAYWMSCNAPGLYDRRRSVWPDARSARAGLELNAKSRNVREVIVSSNIGILGYFAGPNVHILDPMALGDALESRMPVVPGKWAAGNYPREIPDGYLETLRSGTNKITDPGIARFYDHLHGIVGESLWSTRRMSEILRMNLGYYNYLLPRHAKREARPAT